MLDDLPPTAAPAVAQPVLQPTSLNSLRALDPTGGDAFVQRVLSTYLVSLARHVEVVEAARALPDLAAVRAVAHTLKSSSESIGAVGFARQCAALETALRERLASGQGADAALLLDMDQFLAAAGQVRLAVQAELGGLTPS